MALKTKQDAKETTVQRNIRLIKEKKYEELYKSNEAFIYYAIKKYGNVTSDTDELVSLANLAFTKAIKTYDISKESSFSSYLFLLIKNEILMLYRKMSKEIQTISHDEVLFQDADGHQLTISDTIASDINIEKEYLRTEDAKALYQAIDELKPKHKEIASLMLKGHNQVEIANIMGFTQSYISRLEKLIFRDIKIKLTQPRRKNSMKLANNTIQKAALVQKDSLEQAVSKNKTSATKEVPMQEAMTNSKKGLLLRNLTFQTENFLYVINNEKLENLNIAPLTSQDNAFQLDKLKTQNLIEDLNELMNYL